MGNNIKIKFFNPQELAHVSDQDAADGLVGAIRTLESGGKTGLAAKESAEMYRKTWQGMRLINDLVRRVSELESELLESNAKLTSAKAKIKAMESSDSNAMRIIHDATKIKEKIHYVVDRDQFWDGLRDVGFDTERILRPDRFREIAIPRAAVACSLLNHTTLIPQRVAQFMNRDRTTILSYAEQHDFRMDHNADYRQCYESASEAVMRLRTPIGTVKQ